MSNPNDTGPLHYPSLPETVTNRLRVALINTTYAPGDRLLEEVLAEEYQVSRATIRQALQSLAQEGLIELRPRKGAVVLQMSREDAMNLCEARALLEGYSARDAAANITAEELEEMRGLAREMGPALEERDVYGLVELDRAFHGHVARMSHNPRVYELWTGLNSLLGALLASTLDVRKSTPDQVIRRHIEVCDALALQDPSVAERTIWAHYTDIWPQKETGE